MGFMNWRRAGLFLAIAGMETCWLVALSRVFSRYQGSEIAEVSWWSVFVLYIVALMAARTLGRTELRFGLWLLGTLALLTSLLLIQINPGGLPRILGIASDPSTAVRIFILFFGLLVWFRALRIPGQAGDTRASARSFQIGVLILVGSVLAAQRPSVRMNDLVVAYFGFGLLAVALTRIEEVARMEPGGAAPFDLKWTVTLAVTLLIGGVITLLGTQAVTVETARWVLRPFVILMQLLILVSVSLAAQLIGQVLPLLQWLFGDLSVEEWRRNLEEFRPFETPPFPEEESSPPFLSPQLQDALLISAVVVLSLVVLWLILRSFRRWQMLQTTTPGAVREAVTPEGSLAQDLADYLRDQWQLLQHRTDLRRLFRRLSTGSARAIYANLLALMAAADHARQPEQTPYEYAPIAEDVLPTCNTEIDAITEAYVRAHYGEIKINEEELAYLKEAWEWVRSEGERVL